MLDPTIGFSIQKTCCFGEQAKECLPPVNFVR
jgi:hypothetical protein